MKRITALVLSAVLLCGLFTGCGKQSAVSNPTLPTTTPTSPTAPTVSVVPEGRAVKNIIFMIADGGGYDNFTLANKVKQSMQSQGINQLAGAKTQITGNALSFNREGLLVALVVCLALAVTVICAKVIGAVLPMLAKKLGFDPAVMANPFITTIVDALSLLVYFFFAKTIILS